MTEIKQMHSILEEMIRCAEKRKTKKVLELNKEFGNLLLKSDKIHDGEINREYDNCRQSCVISLTTFPEYHKRFMYDAKERFYRLPVPN